MRSRKTTLMPRSRVCSRSCRAEDKQAHKSGGCGTKRHSSNQVKLTEYFFKDTMFKSYKDSKLVQVENTLCFLLYASRMTLKYNKNPYTTELQKGGGHINNRS